MRLKYSLVFQILLPVFAVLFSTSAFAQETAAQAANQPGLPADWTHHYLVFSNPGTEADAIRNGTYDEWLRIVNDPRYVIQQLKRHSPAQGPVADDVTRIEEATRANEKTDSLSADEPEEASAFTDADKTRTKRIKKDWNESLGTTTAPSYASYPAKWSFSDSSASCANDFVVYPTGQAGSSTQASIIAYYNLYSGCGSTVPETDWAYNTGGTIALAPVFSSGGSQVAFIQTSGSVASLVLLTFPLTPPGTGTLGSPKSPTSESASAYSGCAAPCMTSITLNGSPNDTVSRPYYDYGTDSLYVGDSVGKLHKFKPVFSGTPAEVTTSGWPLTLNSSNSPTSPIYDPTSACVFVGDTGGYLYSVNSGNSGTVCTSATASIHGTSSQLDQTYGIRDAPLVDSTAARIYVFAGNDPSDNNGVFQFPTSFTSGSGSEAILASGSDATGTTAYQLAGTFDNTYYTSSTPSSPSGNIYACGTAAPATLYQIAITSNTMGTVTTGPALADSGYYGRCSPVSEFYNTSAPSAATGTVTIASEPLTSWAGVTVTIAGTTYTFETSVTGANQILLHTSGSSSTREEDTAQNLYAVINAQSTECANSGCVYSSQAANPNVTASYTSANTSLTVTAKTAGTAGDFTMSSSNTSDVTVSGVNNGSNSTDFIFLSVFIGTQSGCTDSSSDGCVMSFNVTTPSAFSSSLTALGTLNVSAATTAAPTSGLIIDNLATTPTGASQIYFQTLDPSGTTPCTDVCAVQASQAAP